MTPTERIWIGLIKAYGSIGNYEGATSVLDLLRERGVTPNSNTAFALLRVFVEGKQTQMLLPLLLELMKADYIKLNQEVHKVLHPLLQNKEGRQMTLKVLEELKGEDKKLAKEVQEWLLWRIVRLCVIEGDKEEAAKLKKWIETFLPWAKAKLKMLDDCLKSETKRKEDA